MLTHKEFSDALLHFKGIIDDSFQYIERNLKVYQINFYSSYSSVHLKNNDNELLLLGDLKEENFEPQQKSLYEILHIKKSEVKELEKYKHLIKIGKCKDCPSFWNVLEIGKKYQIMLENIIKKKKIQNFHSCCYQINLLQDEKSVLKQEIAALKNKYNTNLEQEKRINGNQIDLLKKKLVEFAENETLLTENFKQEKEKSRLEIQALKKKLKVFREKETIWKEKEDFFKALEKTLKAELDEAKVNYENKIKYLNEESERKFQAELETNTLNAQKIQSLKEKIGSHESEMVNIIKKLEVAEKEKEELKNRKEEEKQDFQKSTAENKENKKELGVFKKKLQIYEKDFEILRIKYTKDFDEEKLKYQKEIQDLQNKLSLLGIRNERQQYSESELELLKYKTQFAEEKSKTLKELQDLRAKLKSTEMDKLNKEDIIIFHEKELRKMHDKLEISEKELDLLKKKYENDLEEEKHKYQKQFIDFDMKLKNNEIEMQNKEEELINLRKKLDFCEKESEALKTKFNQDIQDEKETNKSIIEYLNIIDSKTLEMDQPEKEFEDFQSDINIYKNESIKIKEILQEINIRMNEISNYQNSKKNCYKYEKAEYLNDKTSEKRQICNLNELQILNDEDIKELKKKFNKEIMANSDEITNTQNDINNIIGSLKQSLFRDQISKEKQKELNKKLNFMMEEDDYKVGNTRNYFSDY